MEQHAEERGPEGTAGPGDQGATGQPALGTLE